MVLFAVSSVADPHQFHADLDPTLQFHTDPDPTADTEALLWAQRRHREPPRLHWELPRPQDEPPRFQSECLWLHCEPPQLRAFHFDADPDPAFTFMRIRPSLWSGSGFSFDAEPTTVALNLTQFVLRWWRHYPDALLIDCRCGSGCRTTATLPLSWWAPSPASGASQLSSGSGSAPP